LRTLITYVDEFDCVVVIKVPHCAWSCSLCRQTAQAVEYLASQRWWLSQPFAFLCCIFN